MKRRGFLKMLGIAPAVVAAAPLLKVPPRTITLYQYDLLPAEYDPIIDPIVTQAANELGWRAGESINDVWQEVFDSEQRAHERSGINEFIHV